MRRFIVEVVVDALLLFVIVLLLGIISVQQPFPFGPESAPIVKLIGAGPIGFITWAAILVLVNRFARPVLVALLGRLLYRTLGLFIVIINALAIGITSFIAPIKIADVAQLSSLSFRKIYGRVDEDAAAMHLRRQPVVSCDTARPTALAALKLA